jgi:hypothetical protein
VPARKHPANPGRVATRPITRQAATGSPGPSAKSPGLGHEAAAGSRQCAVTAQRVGAPGETRRGWCATPGDEHLPTLPARGCQPTAWPGFGPQWSAAKKRAPPATAPNQARVTSARVSVRVASAFATGHRPERPAHRAPSAARFLEVRERAN